jgi:hypothetical protein
VFALGFLQIHALCSAIAFSEFVFPADPLNVLFNRSGQRRPQTHHALTLNESPSNKS